jgi:sugar phosphate isomerase/epimerase
MSAHAPGHTSVGIFAKTFAGSAPLNVLTQARDAGYDTVQYNMACSGLASLPSFIPPAVISGIHDATRASGVGIAALSATYNMIHPDAAVRAAGLQSLRVLAESANALEIPLLTLCSGSRNASDQWAPHPDNDSAESWRDLLASMSAAIALAERYDLVLGIEPEPSNVVASAKHARRLIDELASARVGVIIDAANLIGPVIAESAATQRDVIAHAVDQLGPRIVLVHAKDRRADGAFVAPGQGIVDFNAYFDALDAAGVRAPVIAHGLAPADAAETCRYLRERLRE